MAGNREIFSEIADFYYEPDRIRKNDKNKLFYYLLIYSTLRDFDGGGIFTFVYCPIVCTFAGNEV